MSNRFSTRRDVENHFEGNLGDGWPENVVELVAAAVIDAAHDAGLRYGDDWTEVVDQITGGDDWDKKIRKIVDES